MALSPSLQYYDMFWVVLSVHRNQDVHVEDSHLFSETRLALGQNIHRLAI